MNLQIFMTKKIPRVDSNHTCLSVISLNSALKKDDNYKSHDIEAADFCDKKIPKVDSNHTCLTVISLDYALKKDDNYYPQVFLKECKYIERKLSRHINDNLSDFSSDDDESEEK